MIDYPKAKVEVMVSNWQLVESLLALTIHNEKFDPDWWSEGQGKDIIKAGEMIVREIKAKLKSKGKAKR